jgi:hypothetical protein
MFAKRNTIERHWAALAAAVLTMALAGGLCPADTETELEAIRPHQGPAADTEAAEAEVQASDHGHLTDRTVLDPYLGRQLPPDFGAGVWDPGMIFDPALGSDMFGPPVGGGFGYGSAPGGDDCTGSTGVFVTIDGETCWTTYYRDWCTGEVTGTEHHGCYDSPGASDDVTEYENSPTGDCDCYNSGADVEIVPLVPEEEQGASGEPEGQDDGTPGGDDSGNLEDGLDISDSEGATDPGEGAHQAGVDAEAGGQGGGEDDNDSGGPEDGFNLSGGEGGSDPGEGAHQAGVDAESGDDDDADDATGGDCGDDEDADDDKDGDDGDDSTDGFVGGGNGGPICWDKLREAAAVVDAVTGPAQRLTVENGRTAWEDLQKGDVLAPGAIIRTGFGAHVELGFADQTRGVVRGVAKMGLADLRGAVAAGVALHVKYGAVALNRPRHADGPRMAVRVFRGVTAQQVVVHGAARPAESAPHAAATMQTFQPAATMAHQAVHAAAAVQNPPMMTPAP